jgi:hypothetical protein
VPSTESVSELERTYWHGAGACWIAARALLTSSVACLGDGAGFGATSTRSVPLPCPDEGSMYATQLASADAVHAHSGVVDSTTSPLPPEALMAESGPVRVSVHLTAVGSVDVTAVDPHAASPTAQAAARTARKDFCEQRQTVASTAMNRSLGPSPRCDNPGR